MICQLVAILTRDVVLAVRLEFSDNLRKFVWPCSCVGALLRCLVLPVQKFEARAGLQRCRRWRRAVF